MEVDRVQRDRPQRIEVSLGGEASRSPMNVYGILFYDISC